MLMKNTLFIRILSVLFLFSLVLTGCESDYAFEPEKASTKGPLNGDIGDDDSDAIELDLSEIHSDVCTRENAENFSYMGNAFSIYNVDYRFTKVSMCIRFSTLKSDYYSVTFNLKTNDGLKHFTVYGVTSNACYELAVPLGAIEQFQLVSISYKRDKFRVTELTKIGNSKLKKIGTNTMRYNCTGKLLLYDSAGFIVDFVDVDGKGSFTTVNGCVDYRLMIRGDN